MPSINSDYNSVVHFFKPKKDILIPDTISGIWSLEELNNMSILMSFNNSTFDNHKVTIKLYQHGNWLFKKSNIFTSFLAKCIKYSYQFNFDSDYKHAQIYIKLGSLPLYLPKWLSNWTVDVKDDHIVRKTSILWCKHEYILTKITNNKDLQEMGKFSKFYYS